MTTDELIDYNLVLLYHSPHTFYKTGFSTPKMQLRGIESTRLAENLKSRGLIEVTDMKCSLTALGREISEKGGWLNHLKNLELNSNKEELKSDLDIKHLELQNENLEYSKTLRQKEKEIRDLTMLNFQLQNKQLKRYILYSVISYTLGVLSSYLKGLLNLLQSYIP